MRMKFIGATTTQCLMKLTLVAAKSNTPRKYTQASEPGYSLKGSSVRLQSELCIINIRLMRPNTAGSGTTCGEQVSSRGSLEIDGNGIVT